VVIPCIAGILLGCHQPIPATAVAVLLGIFLCLYGINQYYLPIKQSYKWSFLPGLTLSLCMVCLMWRLTFQYQSIYDEKHFSHIKNTNQFEIRITEVLNETADKAKFYAEVLHCRDNQKNWHSTIGKIVLTIRKDALNSAVAMHDRLLLSGQIKLLEEPLNPSDFNYRYYLSTKDIHHRLYITKWHVIPITKGSDNPFTWSYRARNWCNSIIRKYIKDKKNYGVAEALLLGYKYDIDTNLNQVFARTGTLHVLAVSGMHVGLIFGVLNWLFGLLFKKSKRSILQFALILSCIWSYAFLCGLGPSIVRASIMISFVSLARLSKRKTNTFNLLAASAFFLWLLDPMSLFDPGFQLSYGAVLGIILVYPLIRVYTQHRNIILKYCLELMALSIASQTFTWPISLFYFGQFPNLFLLANLLIIPLTTALIFGLIGLITVTFSDYISTYWAYLLEKGLILNFQIAEIISSWSISVTEQIYITKGETLILLLLTSSFVSWLYHRKSRNILIIFSLIVIFTGMQSWKLINTIRQNEIVKYQLIKGEFYLCLNGTSALIIGEKGEYDSHNLLQQNLKKYFSQRGIRTIQFISAKKMFVSTNFLMIPGIGFQFFDKTMTIAKSD
jgi:competence protein ComEC